MPSNRRYSLRELSPKDYSLYRVICMELESLGHEILIEGTLGTDLEPVVESAVRLLMPVGD